MGEGSENCDACGKRLQGSIEIGRASLCKEICAADVQGEISRVRGEGGKASAIGIARRIFRVRYSAGSYLLRDVPADVMEGVWERVASKGGSIRELIIAALRDYLSISGP